MNLAAYDGFDHLRLALLWDWDSAMFVHTAYFDDSGKKENEWLLVGGYVATVREWNSFNSDWRLALAKKHIHEFKRADYQARRIADWTDSERDSFLAVLAGIIHSYTKHAFAIAISIPDWKRANAKYEMQEYNFYPYPICARTCMKEARDWCAANGYEKHEIEYIFDGGSEHSGHLLEMLKRDGDPIMRKLLPVPGNSEKLPPLQAADYFAWEVRHQTIKNLDPRPSEAYQTLYRLLRFPDAQAKVGHYDFDRLEEMCIAAHVPLRV